MWSRGFKLSVLLLAVLRSTPIHCQTGDSKPLWDPVPQAEFGDLKGARAFQVPSARLNRLSRPALREILQHAPSDIDAGFSEDQQVEVLLPMPGVALPRRFERFRVAESPMLPAELAPHVGDLRTYSGRGIDDPSLSTRFSVTAAGISGIVLGGERVWIIEPISEEERGARPSDSAAGEPVHVSVFKDELPAPVSPLRLERNTRPAGPAPGPIPIVPDQAATLRPERRTFRIAITATTGFTRRFRDRMRGPVSDETIRDSALVAIVQTINQVQALYERELGIRFQFVPRQRELIFVSTDPFSGASVSDALLARNQVVLDRTLTPAGYDIGHVFTGSGGGQGEFASVCDDARKAQGATAVEALTPKVFAIDYVAHEIGHQFDARHTFNSADAGACTEFSRSAEDAFEPGSGSTVMGYAGICRGSNVEAESGSYFHTSSLARISAHLQRAQCGVRTPIQNRAPTVQAKSTWRIPANTPFALSATGSDPDGDRLTYTWEEFYAGPGWAPHAAPPDEATAGQLRPTFRSYPPSRDSVRVFPRMQDLTTRSTSQFERLPASDRRPGAERPLSFRVTARDGRGAFATADVEVEVIAKLDGEPVGPFRVTRPLQDDRVQRGDAILIRWDTAGTNGDPISCVDVRITLDADRSGRFTETLSERTANDGQEHVLIPALPAVGGRGARVKVECVGNIFFNISPSFDLRARH